MTDTNKDRIDVRDQIDLSLRASMIMKGIAEVIGCKSWFIASLEVSEMREHIDELAKMIAANTNPTTKQIVPQLFCRHDWRFARNIYGDEINLMNGRSWWSCYKCGASTVRSELHTPKSP